PGVRFLVDPALVPDTSAPFDAIVIDSEGATISDGCTARARIGRRADRTSIRVRWATCGTLRAVRLNAKVDEPACTTMVGSFVARGTGRRHFTAPASTCGDGRLDAAAGEQCETSAPCADGEPCV